MQRLVLGLCIFAAACSSQSSTSPTAPSASTVTAVPRISSALTGVGTLASAGNVEVTFTKWITTYPNMTGFTGGDVVGSYAGEVLSRIPFDNGVIVQLDARYEVIDPSGLQSFTTIIHGKSTNGTAVLNGVITEGWMIGARTHVTFETITPCQFGTRNVCFQGVIRVMPNSPE